MRFGTARGDVNYDRISVLRVPALSQQCITSFADYESAWRTENTGSNVRRVKGPCLLQVKVLSGKLSVRPGSYRGGEEGNRIAEALGTWAHHGWVCESTGRNASEA